METILNIAAPLDVAQLIAKGNNDRRPDRGQCLFRADASHRIRLRECREPTGGPLLTKRRRRGGDARRLDLVDLDEVATRIIQYGDGGLPRICWLHGKRYAQLFQPLVLLVNIIDDE